MSSNNYFRNLPVPFFSQRQNDYILEEYYTSDVKQNGKTIHKKGELKQKVSMDNRTCNITSVMMVMKYLGLTGIERTVNDTTFTTPNTPKEFLTKYFNHEYDFAFGEDKPTYGVACLENWKNLKKIGQAIFGADCSYSKEDDSSFTLQDLKDEISDGYPVCMSLREAGYGAHLHLQLYLSVDDINKFYINCGIKGKEFNDIKIDIKNKGIVNPFDYREIYCRDK